jgi:hypothetical protein
MDEKLPAPSADERETGTAPGKPAKPSEFLSMGMLIAFGAMFGMSFGVMLDNLMLGMLGGAAAGVVIGAIVEAQRKK